MKPRLDQTIFYVLDKSMKTHRLYAQKKLRENGIKITVDQWLVLKTICDDHDLSQKEIAERVFKDHASITRIIEILVRQGYLIRSFHDSDRRRVNLILTNTGKQLCKQIIPVVISYRKKALQGLSDKELDILIDILGKITINCSSSK